MRKYPTQKRLHEVLTYEPSTGKFFWKIRTARCIKIGDEAGSSGSHGYLKIQIDGVTCQAHILAWIYTHGRKPRRLDHRDLDTANNRIGNLRRSTATQNNANTKKRSGTSSCFKGVTWHKAAGKWQAAIKKAGKNTHLGLFNQEADAGAAYAVAAVEIFGEFARIS